MSRKTTTARSAKPKRGNRKKVKLTGESPKANKWLAMALSKELTIHIPARPYLRPARDENIDQVRKILGIK